MVEIQLRTMDHSVRRSMKNAANCVKYGELQGSRNRYMSNAYGAFIFMMEARLSEGLLNGIDHLLSRAKCWGWLRGLGIHSPLSLSAEREGVLPLGCVQ